MMNKKGAIVLRNLVFMLIIFSTILVLISLFVVDISREYGNTNMETEYNAVGGIGKMGATVATNISEDLEDMKEFTDDSVGSFNLVTGTITGIGSVLGIVIKSPIIIGNVITSVFVTLGMGTTISEYLGNLMIGLIYTIIVFVILSAFLRLFFVIFVKLLFSEQQNNTGQAFASASFICMILAVLLRVTNLINTSFMVIFIILTVVGAIWMHTENAKFG